MARSTGRVRWPIVARCERFWGLQTGPNPTDRAKRGSKRHLICDGHGIPLAIELTGANCHDSTQALPVLDGIPSLQCTSHLAAARNAQYGKRQRFGTMALGHRTYLRVVEPVPSSSPAVREKSRYAQGVSIARVRSDLLEFPTESIPVIVSTKPTTE